MWLQGNACQIPNKRDTPDKIILMIILIMMIKE